MWTLEIYDNLDEISIFPWEWVMPQQSIDLPSWDYNHRKHKVIIQASGQLSLILLRTLGKAPKLEIYDLFWLPIWEIKKWNGTVFLQGWSDGDTQKDVDAFATYLQQLVHEATPHLIEVWWITFETYKHRKVLPKNWIREDRKAKVEAKDIMKLKSLKAFLSSNL